MGFSPLFAPAVGHMPVLASYRATWFPDEGVSQVPGAKLGYVREDLRLTAPYWQDDCNELSGTFHVSNETFNTHVFLPDSGQPFPNELWNVQVGTTYRHLFDNGWIAGGTVTVGSASDKPFHSINEMTAGVNAFLRIPQGEHNAWLFTLNYSPTSELAFPVPGVAFLYQPSDNFRVNIGLPFQLWYRPIGDLTLDLSYMLLRTVHARGTYRVCAPLKVYVGFDWQNEAYFLAGREDDQNRFFYYDKRLTSGVRYDVNRHLSIDLSGGYVFDRFYFEGRSYRDRDNDRIDVGNGPFLSLQGQLRW
jgi:hypothetical protein